MTTTTRWPVLLMFFATMATSQIASSEIDAAAESVTVPLILDDGRPTIDVRLEGPDDSSSSARFLVDTGGGGFIIPESLAERIGITWDETFRTEGREFGRPTVPPKAFLGEFRLPLIPERVLIGIGDGLGLFPGHILARHHVVFDYPGRTLTLAAPGSRVPEGRPLPMPVSSPQGFPRTEIEVGGERYGMLLDTGPAATIISQTVLDSWGEARPNWERHEGPRGEAEALARAGGQVLETMVIEDVQWAGQEIQRLTVASQREGVFEQYISAMMTAPVVGALGSNAFMRYRIELDYLNETLYVSIP